MNVRGSLAAFTVFALVLMAVPASANKVPNKPGMIGPVKTVGFIQGVALVGKRGTCDNQGNYDINGPGLGFPVLSKAKNAWWGIVADVIQATDIAHVWACGMLGPVGKTVFPNLRSNKEPHESNPPKPGLGAACGVNKGWGGRGRIEKFDGTVIFLRDLAWKTDVIGTIVLTGQAVASDKNKPAHDMVVAVVQTRGGFACITKTDNTPEQVGGHKKQEDEGAQLFDVFGTFTISNGTSPNLNNLPATCKSDADPSCFYQTKKTPAPKSS